MESWTTPYDREGTPEKVFLTVRTPDDSRALAVIKDAGEAARSVVEDVAGAEVGVHPDGRASLRGMD